MSLKSDHFTLPNFEGTLDFLLCLIQREEVEIYDVSIQELIGQFLLHLTESKGDELERGADFIGLASYLVWLKSKKLLPRDEQVATDEEEMEDPHFEIIHHLIDYCRFKQAAKELTSRQEKQQACYFRGIDTPELKKPLGLDHVSLEELSGLFKEMIKRRPQESQQIQEETWRVSDKIRFLRRLLQSESHFAFASLFRGEQSRGEIIVIFLAVLELMKSGELAVGKDQTLGTLWLYGKKEE